MNFAASRFQPATHCVGRAKRALLAVKPFDRRLHVGETDVSLPRDGLHHLHAQRVSLWFSESRCELERLPLQGGRLGRAGSVVLLTGLAFWLWGRRVNR